MKKSHYAHFVLYAKGHYNKFEIDETVWGDLKRIQADYCGVPEEYLSKNDIIFILIKAVEELHKPLSLYDFLTAIDPEKVWMIWPNRFSTIKEVEYDYKTAVVGKCLSLLRWIPIYKNEKRILELGEPDPNILNLSKYAKENKNGNEVSERDSKDPGSIE